MKTTYIVTELAGTHVAGRMVSAGDELELTADEALTEELAGTIRRKHVETTGAGDAGGAPVLQPEPAAEERQGPDSDGEGGTQRPLKGRSKGR